MMQKRLGLACAMLAFAAGAVAAPFTAGNIVVVRVGDGSAALTNGGWPVFLDEKTPAGVHVQTIAIPTVTSGANRRLVMNGTSATEGFVSLSADGRYLVVVGYDAPTGGTNVQQAAVDRVIARIDHDGNIDSSTILAAAESYIGSNIRSGVTVDGTAYWTAGTSNPSGSGGNWYVTHGSTSGTKIDTINNTRKVGIYNGKLYTMSASSPNQGLNTYATALPTTTGNATNLLTGWSTTDTYGFVFLADDLVMTAQNTLGLQRWADSGGTWSVTTPDSGPVRDVIGTKSGSNVTLFVTAVSGTTGSAANDLKRWESSNNGVSGTYTTIATAPTNTSYRGIAFVPQAATSAEGWPVYH